MKKWRVGIIGVGGIFNGAHREHYLKDDRLEVVALCDIIEERAVECRDGFFPDAKVYTDFNELLKDETIDSVDICTPNYLHSIIAVAAFKAGKHVFCEKPDAVNVEEVMKMNDAAKAAGKTLMALPTRLSLRRSSLTTAKWARYTADAAAGRGDAESPARAAGSPPRRSPAAARSLTSAFT